MVRRVAGGGWLVRAAFRADEVAALARADEAVAFVQQSANAAQAANQAGKANQAGNAMQGASQSARPPAAPNNPSAATSCATNSLTGDTLVATADGRVPIASLEVGDVVLAYDEDKRQLGHYPVEATWSHMAEQLVYVTSNPITHAFTSRSSLHCARRLSACSFPTASGDARRRPFRGH